MHHPRFSRNLNSLKRLLKLVSVAACLQATFVQVLKADEIELSWNDNSDNEDGFNIERSIGEGPFENIAVVGPDVVTYVDTEAQAGVEYRYRVNAYNAFGNSGYTNVALEYINVSPSISSLGSVSIDQNQTAEGIAFGISDFETDPSALSLVATSSNSGLIDASDIVLGGTGGQRFLALSPKANASGQALITITVSDGEDSAAVSFTLTVNAFDLPTLDILLSTLGEGPRAGEAFTAVVESSDDGLVEGVDFLIDGQLASQDNSAPFEASFSLPESGSYSLAAVARLAGRDETVEVEESIWVGDAPFDSQLLAELRILSSDGSQVDGSATYDLASDTFFLESEEGEIDGTSDSHRFYYLRLEGDVSITARVEDFESSSAFGVGGLMIRSALYGRAEHGALLVKGSGALETRSRSSRGGETQIIGSLGSLSDFAWLRVEKQGTTVRYLAKSEANDSWTLLRSETLDLSDTTFVGFTAASGTLNGSVAATFGNFAFDGELIPWDDQSIEPEVPSGLTITKLDL